LLAFWSKRSEFLITARISKEKAIQSILDDLNVKTKAEKLGKLLNMMSSGVIESEEVESDEDESEDSDRSDEDESDEDSEDSNYLFSNIGKSCHVKITNLVISVNKPKLTNLYAEILSNEESVSIRTYSIYNLWKSKLLKISEIKYILSDLVESNKNKSIEYFDKQIEMVRESRDINLIKLIIKKAIQLYAEPSTSLNHSTQVYQLNSLQTNTNTEDKIIYLKRAIELINIYEPQSYIQIFESFSSSKNRSVQDYFNLAQVNIFF
jgi:hypothetical protein